VDTDLQRRVLEASLGPSTIAHLDTERFRHAMGVARDWEAAAHPPSEAVNGLGYFLTATTWALVSGAVLISFVWWAPLLVMGGWITMTWWGTRFREGPALAQLRSATPLRRAAYYRDLAFEASSAREARIFGLGQWLRGRSEAQWQVGMGRVWAARAARRSLGLTGVSVLVIGYFLLFGLIVQAAFAGTIDVAHATLYVVLRRDRIPVDALGRAFPQGGDRAHPAGRRGGAPTDPGVFERRPGTRSGRHAPPLDRLPRPLVRLPGPADPGVPRP
jgi:ATP-binding cassette subfamily B protein